MIKNVLNLIVFVCVIGGTMIFLAIISVITSPWFILKKSWIRWTRGDKKNSSFLRALRSSNKAYWNQIWFWFKDLISSCFRGF